MTMPISRKKTNNLHVLVPFFESAELGVDEISANSEDIYALPTIQTQKINHSKYPKMYAVQDT